MKKIILFLLLITSVKTLYGQNTGGVITALEVTVLQSNIIQIQWRFDKPQGSFLIYYNKFQSIQNLEILGNSDLALTTNLSGIPLDSLFLYDVQVELRDSGEYYFAILANDPKAIDAVAKGLDVPKSDTSVTLIPNLNTLVKPVTINKNLPKFKKEEIFVSGKIPPESLITSLRLESEKDLFRLRWAVHPKNLEQYVFTVYRSRYPISRYPTSFGLPAYAVLTNQFFFEDRNISFETPYYYAVVPQKSNQWQSGINIFEKPAILLKNSPSFYLKPTVEYVKKKIQSPVQTSVLNEEDIQTAVQQTLFNLRLLPQPVFSGTNTPSIINPISVEETERLKLIGVDVPGESPTQNEALPKLDSSEDISISEQAKKNLIALRKNTFKLQRKAGEEFIKEKLKQEKNIARKINVFRSEILDLLAFETKLINAYAVSDNVFKNCLKQYYRKRDHVGVVQYDLRNDILTYHNHSEDQNFLDNIALIQKKEAENRQKSIDNSIDRYHRQLAKLRKTHSERFNRVDRLNQENIRNNYINSLSSVLAKKVTNVDPKAIFGEKKFGSVSPIFNNNDDKPMMEQIPDFSKDQELYIQKQEQTFVAGNDFSWTNNVETFLPPNKSPEEQLQIARTVHKKLTVEKIPNIKEISFEKWLSKEDIQKHLDVKRWNHQNKIWNERIFEILGESRYHRIQSKWMKPGPVVAINESTKAFAEGRYDEALYLLSFVSKNKSSVMRLGRTFYELGAYRDAFVVFITASHLGVTGSRKWVDLTAEKLLKSEKN